MGKGSRGLRRNASHKYRPSPYLLHPCKRDIHEDLCPKKCSKALDKKDWEDVTCSVCMEYPHNAVLLLCSSYDKGCRPYMCGTSFRHSNCLDQYEKAYTKMVALNNGQPMQGSISNPSILPDSSMPLEKSEVAVLACPLCRGQVKGWTVLKSAREYLNAKKRSCMQDNCSFVGNYKELKKHVRAEHPSGRPRDVDPAHEQKWRWLEWERERQDVISTITSTMPGAMVFGDYVIEGDHQDFGRDEEGDLDADAADRNGRYRMGMEAMNLFLLLHAVRQGNDLSLNRQLRPEVEMASHRVSGHNGARHTSPVGRLGFSYQDDDNDRYSEGDEDGISLASHLHRHGNGRVLLSRSGRRRRRRRHPGQM